MEKAKKRISLRLIFFIVFLIIIGTLILNYLVTRKDPLSFVPVKYNLMVQTPPLKTIYEKYLPLEVVDIALSAPSSAEIRKFIFMLRDNPLLKNLFLRELINIPVIMVMESKKSSLFIFDLKWRSIITKILPFISYNLSIKNLQIIKQEKLIVFRIVGNTDLYFSFVDNVLLFSFDIKTLENAYNRLKTKDNFFEKKSKKLVSSLLKDSNIKLKIVVSPEEIIREFTPDSMVANKIIQKLKFNEDGLVDILLLEDKINIDVNLPLYSDDIVIQKFLSKRFNYLNSLKFVASDAGLISIINLADLKELVEVFKTFQIVDIESQINKANDAIKTLFGKDIDNLIFNWIGSEIGLYKTPSSKEPVIFIKIKDEKGYKDFINNVLKSLIIENANPIKIDDIIIDQIRIADFLSFLLGIFNIKIPSAYYISLGNYLFLSMDPENIKTLVKNFREKKIFYETDNFKKMSKNFSLYSGIFSYYDTEIETPAFIKDKGLLSKILKYYGKGSIALWQVDKDIKIGISALGGTKTLMPYINYPKEIEIDLNKPLMVGELGETVFLFFSKNVLTIRNLDLKEIFSTNFNENADIITLSKKFDRFLVALPDSSKIIDFEYKNNAFTTKEIENIDFTFTPFIYKDNIYYFSKEDSKFYKIDLKTLSKEDAKILETENPVLSSPDILKEYWALYEKSFEGKVYLLSYMKIVSGWPKSVEGISSISPVIVTERGFISVYFMTQGGMFYGWNYDSPISNLPQEIEGSFNAPLMVLNVKGDKKIVALSKEGILYIFNREGKIENKINIENMDKEAKIYVYDIDRDDVDEIFVYNNKNNIYGYKKENDKLIEIEGFPLRGYTKPEFYDINKDGKLEIITGGVGKLYIYSLKK